MISDESLAAWLDGNATPHEAAAINAALDDPDSILAEVVDLVHDTELYNSLIEPPVEIIDFDMPLVEPDDADDPSAVDGDFNANDILPLITPDCGSDILGDDFDTGPLCPDDLA